MLKFLSVNNIVITPANTGKESNNKIAVTKIDQTNKGILSMVIPDALILIMVVIKLRAPNIEEIPAKCKLNITKSTEPPECTVMPDKGG